MTTLCGGGASAPKAGVNETIIFTAGSLSSLLNNKGGAWASIAAPLLGVLAYSATNLCSTDPPAQPTISDDEYTALLQLGPWDTLQSALVKLADIVTRLIWFDMCECSSVATPPLPSGTLAPPIDVTLPNYSAGSSCPQPRLTVTIPEPVPPTPVPRWANITARVFPGMPLVQSTASSSFVAADAIVWPSHWGTGVMRGTLRAGNPGAGIAYTVFLGGHGSTGTFDNTLGQIQLSAAVTSDSETFPAAGTNWRYLSAWMYSNASAVTDGTVDLEIDINCSTAGTPSSGCCSDPASLAMLGQIMQQVNLIQRQQVPFAYVQGASHTGLTGNGTIDVQGLIGALVEITSGLANVGTEDGSPDETFEAGWITWGNPDGFGAREFISNATLVSLPNLAGQFTRIGYTLSVGVTVTITELIREP